MNPRKKGADMLSRLERRYLEDGGPGLDWGWGGGNEDLAVQGKARTCPGFALLNWLDMDELAKGK